MRKLISLFAAVILTVHLTGCTSKDSKDDAGGDEAVASETAGTDAELQALDAPPPTTDPSVASNKEGTNEGFLDDQLPEDALGESSKVAKSDAPVAGPLDTTTPPPMDEPKSEAKIDNKADAGFDPPIEATPAETANAAVDPGTPTMSEPAPAEKTPDSNGTVASASETSSPPPVSESKPKASLQKIESAPMTRAGVLLNAVYVARPGDNYKKISSMIYGSSEKERELKKVNKGISKPKPGDKIYYNSPVRSTDDTKLLTFYEDSGVVPEVYVAQEGDDLKKVSKKILGYDNAWKEIWETNSIDSKGALTAGTELRYWKSTPAPAKTTAVAKMTSPPAAEMNPPPMPEMPPASPPEMAPPPPPAPPVAETSPAPPAEASPAVANNQAAPPPPPDMPPPPPPDMQAPPAEGVNPPPPPAVAKKGEPAVADAGMDNNDMTMALAGAGILALGAFAVIIARKRKQNREAAVAFNDTQVGT